MFSIPSYFRKKDNQNDNMKPNPTSQNGHPQKLQTVDVGEGQELIEPQNKVGGNGHCQQPLEKTASACQNTNISRELSLVYGIYTWTYMPRNPSFKKTHAPQYSLLYCL